MADRVLILGASGFIGSYLRESLGQVKQRVLTGTYHSHETPGLVPLNVLDVHAMRELIGESQPQFVVFLAGTKDVERCEKMPAYALDLNVQAVRNYVEACLSLKVRPVTLFFSTDYVFDGFDGHYSRSSCVGPRTVYGLTNLLAERILGRSNLPGVILRVSAVMGRRGGFFRWLETSLIAEESISLFDNTYFSPTSVGRLCRFVENCAAGSGGLGLDAGMRIVHLSDAYRLTRYQFGCAVAGKLGKPLTLLQPSLADLSTTTFQSDLSLLPDGVKAFRPSHQWDELGEIF
ncbi:sugar nucleotide-binding protein [Curvibacter sp. CHRR-16]|uniref:SDR family oxidoreductase n=1 Tax=Curvibacter sp. CHRR-16 TaxID=2835872 RepID=UPI001BDB48AE|nr:sugar nucleotide-binding protein [Curvibacter sp. CHRR-16]MBT0571744.1 sugar nucleotide-binding protein [Curvibacter sp. CHRR-16]